MKRELFTTNTPFIFESGEKLDSLDICYHHTDNYSPDKKVIWICHALTANSNPQEWWSGLTGPGKLFDTKEFYIICANMIGSCYGSSGPSTINREGKPFLLTFPQVTVRDIVRAHNILRQHLGIGSIDLMTGGSIGGFQALEWSIMYPDAIKNIVLIACNARVSPWGTAYNESQRMALFADSTFQEQNSIDGGKLGLEAARSIALISYRSYEGYGITQQEPEADNLFAIKVGNYQRYQGKKLSDRFDAYSYFNLTKSVDSHNVGRGRGDIARALGQIKASAIVMGIAGDNLFPLEEQKFLFNNIKNAKFEVITSLFGHDGFLLEWDQIKSILKKQINFLN